MTGANVMSDHGRIPLKNEVKYSNSQEKKNKSGGGKHENI